jgi:hypothetical protein
MSFTRAQVNAPATYPCPACGSLIERSIQELEIKNAIEAFKERKIKKVIWSDRAIRARNSKDAGFNPPAPLCQLDDYIAVCPACESMFPALILPWDYTLERQRVSESVETSKRESVVKGPNCQVTKKLVDRSITRASFEQTVFYLEVLQDRLALSPEWATWTAAQQIVILGSEIVRSGHKIDPALEERAKACLRDFLTSIGNIKEGTLRNLASWTLTTDNAHVPQDYFNTLFMVEESAVLSNMGRISQARDDYGMTITRRYLPSRHWPEQPVEAEWLGELLMENEQNDAWAVCRPIPSQNSRPLREFIDGSWVERELDLGDVLDELDIDYNAGPGYLFAVHRETGLLEAIAMIGDKNPDEVIMAIKGAYARDKQALDYWNLVDRSQFETYISGDYELWLFGYGLEGEEPDEVDTAEETELQYELPIVQRWSKNEVLRREDVEPIARFIGYQYSMEELAHFLG